VTVGIHDVIACLIAYADDDSLMATERSQTLGTHTYFSRRFHNILSCVSASVTLAGRPKTEVPTPG